MPLHTWRMSKQCAATQAAPRMSTTLGFMRPWTSRGHRRHVAESSRLVVLEPRFRLGEHDSLAVAESGLEG